MDTNLKKRSYKFRVIQLANRKFCIQYKVSIKTSGIFKDKFKEYDWQWLIEGKLEYETIEECLKRIEEVKSGMEILFITVYETEYE